LLKIAAKRRRNYILDQTNIYSKARKEKMSNFSGFKRKALVIVQTEEDAKFRAEKKLQEEGKDVSDDSAVLLKKSNFKIPSVDDTFSEVEFSDLALEEALKVIEKYSTELKAARYCQLLHKRKCQNQTYMELIVRAVVVLESFWDI
jgi:heterogeneous nuclear ribonucleoprotein U-like protein 1